MATAEAQKLAAVARALPSVCTKDATLYQDYQAGIHVLIPYQHFATYYFFDIFRQTFGLLAFLNFRCEIPTVLRPRRSRTFSLGPLSWSWQSTCLLMDSHQCWALSVVNVDDVFRMYLMCWQFLYFIYDHNIFSICVYKIWHFIYAIQFQYVLLRQGLASNSEGWGLGTEQERTRAASHVVFCSRWRQLCLALVSAQLWILDFSRVYTDTCQTLWYMCN
jgi:hypothetical protein